MWARYHMYYRFANMPRMICSTVNIFIGITRQVLLFFFFLPLSLSAFCQCELLRGEASCRTGSMIHQRKTEWANDHFPRPLCSALLDNTVTCRDVTGAPRCMLHSFSWVMPGGRVKKACQRRKRGLSESGIVSAISHLCLKRTNQNDIFITQITHVGVFKRDYNHQALLSYCSSPEWR